MTRNNLQLVQQNLARDEMDRVLLCIYLLHIGTTVDIGYSDYCPETKSFSLATLYGL